MTKRTHILLLILTILIIFIKSLGHDFVWDDYDLVVTNSYIKSSAWLKEIFTEHLYQNSGKDSNFYRPIQLLAYILEYKIWELNPFGYHLTSLVLQISNSILIYLILTFLAFSPVLAFFTSMLFGIAPMISSTTFYISAQSDLLAVSFMFLSIYTIIMYYKKERLICYVSSLLFFILSLLSKEMAISFPFLLIIIFFKMRENNKFLSWKYLMPYFVISIIYCILRLTWLDFGGHVDIFARKNFVSSFSLYERLLIDIKVLTRYLRLFILPYPLHMEWYIEPVHSFFNRDIMTSFSVLLITSFLLVRLYRINKIVLFGVLWFLISLSPVLNIYPISVFFGEGWLYLPSVGIFIILGIFFIDVIGRRYSRKLRNFLFLTLLIYYSFFTISYSEVWTDSISLFENVIKYERKHPFIFRIYNNLSMAYYSKGEYDKAVENSKKSLSSNPRFTEAYNNLGVIYIAQKRYVKAIKCFKIAIELDRDYLLAYNNLAHAYANIGLDDKALSIVKKTLAINPDFHPAYYSLGFIYSKKGDIEKAIDAFEKSKRLEPTRYESYLCLGDIYRDKKEYKKALQEYENIMSLVTVNSDFYNTLAFLYLKNRNLKKAEWAYRRSLLLDRRQANVYNNLGNLYSLQKRHKMAIINYRYAVKLNPENRHFYYNLKNEWKKTLIEDHDFIKEGLL